MENQEVMVSAERCISWNPHINPTVRCTLHKGHKGLHAGLGHIWGESCTSANEPVVKSDPVNHPNHYTQGGIECIKAIQAALTPEEYRGFLKGQVIKYIWRELHKNGAQDVGKAGVYLDWLKELDNGTL